MASLPQNKAPMKDSDGEAYRRKQMMTQLPAHDNDERFCDSLTDDEKQRMKDFLQLRNEKAVGIGEVGELADTKEASKFVSHDFYWYDVHIPETRMSQSRVSMECFLFVVAEIVLKTHINYYT